jgi:glycosyltransferase involved in cell wall biosynthesis
MQPLVSVIITTKNEEQVLASCIRSIQNQTYFSIETIVVDNNSGDHTKDIATSFGVQVFDKGPERSSQRNFGAKKAKGTYLLFLDADMELTLKVVEEAVVLIGQKTMSRGQKKYKALVIPEESFGIGFWAACKALERSYYLGVPWIESARFFEKKAFQAIGGYDETLTGPEDFELPQRMKQIYG